MLIKAHAGGTPPILALRAMMDFELWIMNAGFEIGH